MAYIGAAIYFAQHSHGFWGIVLALLKGAVWPAYVMHAVLQLLNIWSVGVSSGSPARGERGLIIQ